MNENWPEAYRKGIKDFYGRDFAVSPDVLIPRPETEAAIDELLLLAGKPYLSGMKAPERKLSDRPIIVDVGTGSGCIAVTAKLKIPEAEVFGLDISCKALNVARNNAEKFGAKVDFVESDLLQNYHGSEPEVILANLPYVDKNWEWLDKKALSYEPREALFAEEKGLALIFRLIKEAEKRTKWLFLEADPCQHMDIIKYASAHGSLYQKTSGFWLVFGID